MMLPLRRTLVLLNVNRQSKVASKRFKTRDFRLTILMLLIVPNVQVSDTTNGAMKSSSLLHKKHSNYNTCCKKFHQKIKAAFFKTALAKQKLFSKNAF